MSSLRLMALTALLSVIAGCASDIHITDVAAGDDPNYQRAADRKLYRDADKLIVEIDQSPNDLLIASVEPNVYDGDLYLSAFSISAPGRKGSRFEIDVGKLGLAQDWDKRVYWCVGGSYDGGINALFHRGPLAQHQKRLKAEVVVRSGE